MGLKGDPSGGEIRRSCAHRYRQKIETFDYAECKPIIDDIDCALARHFGLNEEELDLIINYDIKYRMGRDTENEEED